MFEFSLSNIRKNKKIETIYFQSVVNESINQGTVEATMAIITFNNETISFKINFNPI